jgi:hypothetical protein
MDELEFTIKIGECHKQLKTTDTSAIQNAYDTTRRKSNMQLTKSGNIWTSVIRHILHWTAETRLDITRENKQ